MTIYWPPNMKVGPIGEWPGERTRRPQSSRFASRLSETLETLNRELRALGAKNTELLIAVDPAKFRLDGYPRAGTTPDHPGIILSFDTEMGHLSYPCDTFNSWEDNLRAIALSLESLRRVDRYGVTKRGEQYRGFLAIEARAAGQFTSTEQALSIVEGFAGEPLDSLESNKKMFRRALRNTHPDYGHSADDHQRVNEAIEFLKKNGISE